MTTQRGVRWTIVASAASALWLLAASAFAQGPHHRPPPERGAADGGGPPALVSEQRPAQFAPRDAEPREGGNRLSPEERRQLRRDVHEAGRALYSDRMPPGRREPRRP